MTLQAQRTDTTPVESRVVNQWTRQGWAVPEDLSTPELEEALDYLDQMESGVGLCRGDALVEWEQREDRAYGDLKALCEAKQWKYKTARNVKWICERVPLSHRWDNLGLRHYEAVAPIDTLEDRYEWLERAAEAEDSKPWTVAKLRGEIRREKARREIPDDRIAPVVHQTDARSFLESFDDASIPLLLTDPPYMTDVEDIAEFSRSWLPLALSKIADHGRGFIFAGAYPEEMLAYLSVLKEEARLTLGNVLVWTYENTMGPAPSHEYKLNWQSVFYVYGPDAPPLDCPLLVEQFTVQDISAPDERTGIRYHAWQKPDEIAERFIRHASKPGDKVVDPFTGTGTFLLAASRLGRVGVGCECDPAMAQISRDRGCEIQGEE